MARTIREWTLLEEIGRGGMGVVYKATHEILPGYWAVKVIRPELTEDVESRQRFVSEVLVLSRLRHDHIIEIQTPFQEAGQLYLPMEYLTGRSVKDMLDKDQSPWPAERAVDVIRQAAAGLGYAHRQNPSVLHRDIKPGNIQVLDDGRVKVLDFGLARTLGEKSMTAMGKTVGTPAYMAPEVLDGKKATPGADVYSLGVVLYRLLAGRLPIDMPEEDSSVAAMLLAVVRAHQLDLPDVREFAPGVSAGLAGVIAATLSTDPARRPVDGSDLAAKLAAVPVMASTGGKAADATYLGIELVSKGKSPPAIYKHAKAARWKSVLRDVDNFLRSFWNSRFRLIGIGVVCVVGLAVGGGILWASQNPDRALEEVSVLPEGANHSEPNQNVEVMLPSRAVEKKLADNGMVVVPAGDYPVGCGASSQGCYGDEKPASIFRTAGYGIGKFEVTVGDYQKCVLARACSSIGNGEGCNAPNSGRDDHPVNCVTWMSAAQYCAWKDLRLPTEFEWEAAARGSAGLEYPWGSGVPDCNRAVSSSACEGQCGPTGSSPVGSCADDKSPFGLMDLGGNVREWTADYYKSYDKLPHVSSGFDNSLKVNRGGSWAMAAKDLSRTHTRITDNIDAMLPDLGFRCAMGIQK